MQLIRYRDSDGRVHFGTAHEDGRVTRVEGDILAAYHDTGEVATVAKWLAPIEPRDIICIGLNYRKHADEGGQAIPEQPIVFMKNVGTVQNPGDPIVLPRRLRSDAVDYECELAVVIGRTASRVSRDAALDYVAGYTIGNDYAIRDYLENYYRPNLRVKNRDSATLLGPWLTDAADVPDPMNLALRTMVNGKLTQQGTTADMIFGVAQLIEYLSSFMTLGAGDVILTGTPEGVVNVNPGDVVVTQIESLGSLTSLIVADPRDGVHE